RHGGREDHLVHEARVRGRGAAVRKGIGIPNQCMGAGAYYGKCVLRPGSLTPYIVLVNAVDIEFEFEVVGTIGSGFPIETDRARTRDARLQEGRLVVLD